MYSLIITPEMENYTSSVIVRHSLVPSGPDYINDKTNYAFRADIYNCTGEVLDFPRTNGYSCAINHKDNQVYFGLVTDSNGAGLFVYDRNTKTCSQSPVIKAQGTIMDMVIY